MSRELRKQAPVEAACLRDDAQADGGDARRELRVHDTRTSHGSPAPPRSALGSRVAKEQTPQHAVRTREGGRSGGAVQRRGGGGDCGSGRAASNGTRLCQRRVSVSSRHEAARQPVEQEGHVVGEAHVLARREAEDARRALDCDEGKRPWERLCCQPAVVAQHVKEPVARASAPQDLCVYDIRPRNRSRVVRRDEPACPEQRQKVYVADCRVVQAVATRSVQTEHVQNQVSETTLSRCGGVVRVTRKGIVQRLHNHGV